MKSHTKREKIKSKAIFNYMYLDVIGHVYANKNKNQYLNSKLPLYIIENCYFLASTEENGKMQQKEVQI